MSKVLWNPTDEVLKHEYGGILIELTPGQKKKLPDRAANHLLTKLSTRGLTSLEYGDTPETEIKKKKAALERQRKFEMNQVRMYNIDNMRRKRNNQIWVEPPMHIQKFANKHSMKLEESWSTEDLDRKSLKDAKERAEKAEERSERLEKQLEELSVLIRELATEKHEREELTKLDKRTKEYKEKREELIAKGIIVDTSEE